MTLLFHAKIIQFCFMKCLATILFGTGKESILMTIEEGVVLCGHHKGITPFMNRSLIVVINSNSVD